MVIMASDVSSSLLALFDDDDDDIHTCRILSCC